MPDSDEGGETPSRRPRSLRYHREARLVPGRPAPQQGPRLLPSRL